MENARTNNTALFFLTWWYAESPRQFKLLAKLFLRRLLSVFSVKIIIRTYFMPWKRISTEAADGSIQERLKALEDNLVSRIIGVVMRTFILIGAFFALAAYGIALAVFAALWPFMPFLPAIIIVLSLGFLI